MEAIDEDRFVELVEAAIDDLPDEIIAMLDNVAIVVEDRNPDEPSMLGLYEGIPQIDRDDGYFGALPDRIAIYRLALCDMCEDDEDLVEEIAVTVVHELAHHMGIDDDQLHDLGWG